MNEFTNYSALVSRAIAKGWVRLPEPRRPRPRKPRVSDHVKRGRARLAMRRYRAVLRKRIAKMWQCPVCGKLRSCDWCYECQHATKRRHAPPPE